MSIKRGLPVYRRGLQLALILFLSGLVLLFSQKDANIVSATSCISQPKTFRGTVKDNANKVLANAQVVVESPTKSVVATDSKGKYSVTLTVNSCRDTATNNEITYSKSGYVSQTKSYAVKSNSRANLPLIKLESVPFEQSLTGGFKDFFTVTLSWSPYPGATYYTLQKSKDSFFSFCNDEGDTCTDVGTNLSADVKAQDGNGNYDPYIYYQVIATFPRPNGMPATGQAYSIQPVSLAQFPNEFSNPNQSSPTDSENSQPNPVIAAPSNFSALQTGYSPPAVTLSWSEVNGNKGYKIKRKTSLITDPNFSDYADPAEGATSYVDNNVSADITYVYKIYTKSDSGKSADSPEQQVTVNASAQPTQPPVDSTPPPAEIGIGSVQGTVAFPESLAQGETSTIVFVDANRNKIEAPVANGLYSIANIPIGEYAVYIVSSDQEKINMQVYSPPTPYQLVKIVKGQATEATFSNLSTVNQREISNIK